MKRYRCKGTITVFLSLLLVLFLSLACTLVESARLQGTRAKAGVVTDMGLFSVFGEYERGLLEDYDVFFVDGSYGTGTFGKERLEKRFQNYMEGNVKGGSGSSFKGFQMFPLSLASCQVETYALMTDNDGAVFYQQVVKNGKETVGTEAVRRYLELKGQAEKQEKEGQDYESQVQSNGTELTVLEEQARQEEAARQAAEQAEQAAQTESGVSADGVIVVQEGAQAPAVQGAGIQAPAVQGKSGQSTVTQINPLDVIKKVKNMGILGLVVKDESMVSQKAVKKEDLPSGRKRNKGNLRIEETESGLTAEAIFQDYLAEHFSCMTSSEREGALEYQLEYILGGKMSDRENLKYVVNRLLLMREGTNFVFALADTSMRRQAEAVALSLAGATGIGALVPAVTTALLLAWAYGESLLDVRTLLAGGKVELTKTAQNWKLSVSNLGRILEILEACDGGGGEGLDYESYLRLLVAGGSQKNYPMRALDMIEANLRLKEDTANFRADNCVAKIEAQADWKLPVIFLRVPMAFMGKGTSGREVRVSGCFGY